MTVPNAAAQVAAIQMTSGKAPQANLEQAAELLQAARDKGASLAVLPENFAGYGGDYRELAAEYATLEQWLCEQASRLGMAIIGGSVPSLSRPDGEPVPAPRVRTRSLAVTADGETLAVTTSFTCLMPRCRTLRASTGSPICLNPVKPSSPCLWLVCRWVWQFAMTCAFRPWLSDW